MKSKTLAPAPTYVLSEATPIAAAPTMVVAFKVVNVALVPTTSVALKRVMVALTPTKSVLLILT